MKKDVRYVKWSDEFSVGIKQIDKQHKHFVGLMNELFEAIQTDEKFAVSKIIRELASYANTHFATEEEYFDKFNYKEAKQHKAEHEEIRKKVKEFLVNKDSDPFALGYSLLDLLENWLFNHIITTDKKYVAFFKEKGIR
jgi:hemerythrin-like metal-binding protein